MALQERSEAQKLCIYVIFYLEFALPTWRYFSQHFFCFNLCFYKGVIKLTLTLQF